jgi:hypothetical protein
MVCGKPYTMNVETSSVIIECECGRRHVIERGKENSYSTLECDCGKILYLEGGGTWREFPNPIKKSEGIKHDNTNNHINRK